MAGTLTGTYLRLYLSWLAGTLASSRASRPSHASEPSGLLLSVVSLSPQFAGPAKSSILLATGLVGARPATPFMFHDPLRRGFHGIFGLYRSHLSVGWRARGPEVWSLETYDARLEKSPPAARHFPVQGRQFFGYFRDGTYLLRDKITNNLIPILFATDTD